MEGHIHHRKSSLPSLTEIGRSSQSCTSHAIPNSDQRERLYSDNPSTKCSSICSCHDSSENQSELYTQCHTHICLSGSFDKHYHSDTELLNPKLQEYYDQDSSESEGNQTSRDSLSNSCEETTKLLTCLSDKTMECGGTSFQNTVNTGPGRTFGNHSRCRLCFREQCYGCRYFIGYSRVSFSALKAAASLPNISRQRYKSVTEEPDATVGGKKFTTDQKLTMFCIGIINLTAFLSMSIIAPFFPKEAALKNMRESVSGLVFSVYALVVMLASPLFGKIAPLVGVKFLYIAGIGVSGISNILFGVLVYIENDTMFAVYCFVVRAFEALGCAAFSTAANIIILESFPDDIGTVFGLMETCVGLGMSIGPAVGGGLYALGGYGLPFYVLGSLVLLNLPLNLFLLKITPAKFCPNSTSSYRKLLSIPLVLIISLVVVIASQSQGFIDPTLEPHLRQFNLGSEIVGLLFLLMSAAYALLSPAVGYISGKYEIKYPLMITGLAVMTVALLLIGPSPFLPFDGGDLWINILAIVLLGISLAFAYIPTFEAIFIAGIEGGLRDDIGTYSIVSGLWSSMYSLGEVTGPTLGGVLSDFLDFPLAATTMALCSFLTLLLIIATWLWPKRRSCNQSRKESDSGISDNSRGSSDRLVKSLKSSYGSADPVVKV